MISFSRSFCHFPVQLVPACKLFKELVTGSCLEDFPCVFVCADIKIKKKKKKHFGSLEKRKMRLAKKKKKLTSEKNPPFPIEVTKRHKVCQGG